MRRSISRSAFTLALAAMLLRALLPVGWMPNAAAQGQAFLTICTMDGLHRVAVRGAPKPTPEQGSREHAGVPCPFASAAPFAPLVHAAVLAPPSQSVSAQQRLTPARLAPASKQRANTARAPPISLA